MCLGLFLHIPVVPHLHEPMNIKGRNNYFYTIHEDVAVSMLAMNAQRGVDIEQYSLLTSALNGGGWSALYPGLLALRERVPRKNSTGG